MPFTFCTIKVLNRILAQHRRWQTDLQFLLLISSAKKVRDRVVQPPHISSKSQAILTKTTKQIVLNGLPLNALHDPGTIELKVLSSFQPNFLPSPQCKKMEISWIGVHQRTMRQPWVDGVSMAISHNKFIYSFQGLELGTYVVICSWVLVGWLAKVCLLWKKSCKNNYFETFLFNNVVVLK
jgi:hypothetical protein